MHSAIAMWCSCDVLCADDQSEWQSGFFDKGSFIETLKPWAQSVVCGRARFVWNPVLCYAVGYHTSLCIFRLGGIPVGVIAVESRSVECVVPADPANVDSEAQVPCLLLHLCLGYDHMIDVCTYRLWLKPDWYGILTLLSKLLRLCLTSTWNSFLSSSLPIGVVFRAACEVWPSP